MKKSKQVIVIGGGAAGMMAAIAAAYKGASVTILEHNPSFGKKLLATGNGRCNLTNQDMQPIKFRGSTESFVTQVLAQFSMFDTLRFFQKLGIYTKNRNGYLYPYCEQASSVLDNFLMELKRLHIKCKTNEQVEKVSCTSDNWEIRTNTWTYTADAVILATGSGASRITGADFSGLEIAKELGHLAIEPLPALVPLVGSDTFYGKWAGVRVTAKATLLINKEPLCEEQGELQLTQYGVSGIPVMQLSRYAVKALHEKKQVMLELDFMPDFSEDALESFLKTRKENSPQKTDRELLIGLFPEKLISLLLDENNQISLDKLKHFKVSIKNDRGFEDAQAAQGGVDTQEITPETMESKIQPSLYFAGEIVDVDGTCGGYNLQWAWSTGYIAGSSAGEDQYDTN